MTLAERILFYPRQRRGDTRGWLLKTLDGSEAGLPANVGECYVVMAHPGQTRGGHFHPVAKEWFTLLAGAATLLLADPKTGERHSLVLRADEPVTVYVPAGIAHAFRNEADAIEPMLLFAYTDQRYDPADTISFGFND